MGDWRDGPHDALIERAEGLGAKLAEEQSEVIKWRGLLTQREAEVERLRAALEKCQSLGGLLVKDVCRRALASKVK